MEESKQPIARDALWTLAGALAMGVLGDVWLRATPGMNVVLWTSALVGMAALLARRQGGGIGAGRGLALPALFFAAAFAWRDSPTLRALDALALLVCLGLAAGAAAREGRLARAGFLDYARDVLASGARSAFGGLRLTFGDIRWRELPRGGETARRLTSVGVGVAVALPLLLVFGGLFASADPVFRRLVQKAFAWDFDDLLGHLEWTTLGALLVGGFLRGLFWGTAAREYRRPAFLALGAVEMGVALGLLDLLFLAFVLVQLRYFFGGARLVQATTGLTYAQYARGGFFELVAVAALVLPLLLTLHGLFRSESPRGARLFRALAGLQVGLLFVIMASATQRMRLYQGEYGQTELRLYVTAFMAWLALVFVWFVLTVLRGRRERFAFGALLSAFGMIALLHALNPDAAIVRANAALARAGRPFDVDYALSLSADAVPALLAARPALPPPQAQAVTARLAAAWTPPRNPDWRSWNWSRVGAWRLAAGTRDKGTPVARAK
ncbi:MAG: DUF4173 domain-containing protein [Armatimonadetes bacterium]|nr:DUF4173 domain-containing protein [Armatimonadota bacterium]